MARAHYHGLADDYAAFVDRHSPDCAIEAEQLNDRSEHPRTVALAWERT